MEIKSRKEEITELVEKYYHNNKELQNKPIEVYITKALDKYLDTKLTIEEIDQKLYQDVLELLNNNSMNMMMDQKDYKEGPIMAKKENDESDKKPVVKNTTPNNIESVFTDENVESNKIVEQDNKEKEEVQDNLKKDDNTIISNPKDENEFSDNLQKNEYPVDNINIKETDSNDDLIMNKKTDYPEINPEEIINNPKENANTEAELNQMFTPKQNVFKESQSLTNTNIKPKTLIKSNGSNNINQGGFTTSHVIIVVVVLIIILVLFGFLLFM